MSTIAYVSKLPDCAFHKHDKGEQVPAAYDVRTHTGQWASVCDDCRIVHAATFALGTGKGQRYVVGEPPARDLKARRERAHHALLANNVEEFMDAVGDGDPAEFLA
jgi:hypothetical protein